jgi:cell cycle sensor histidine kinase DivJ
MGNVGLFAPVLDYIDTLVHPAARCDAFTAARHRAFIATRLLGSVIVLAAFPPYLLVHGAPQPAALVLAGWLIAPIFITYFLSRTGRYENAHVFSSLALTGLVTAIAVCSGGIGSFSAVWLVLVPLDAALSGSRRAVALAAIFTFAAVGLLVFVGGVDLPAIAAANGKVALAALGIVSASLCAAGLALRAQSLACAGLQRLNAAEDRYRLLAHNMTEVIIRHGRDGALLFASPSAQSLFGCRIDELSGHGLFDRVHVADRPAYLDALGNAAASGTTRSVEFRVRRECLDSIGRKATEFVWVEMHCQPIERPRGTTASRGGETVAVLRDVTERRRQEQALVAARMRAECADAANDRFLAAMNLELRPPLNAIIRFSEMLMNETVLLCEGKRRQEYAVLINESGKRLLTAVNDILDRSKIETGNFATTPEPFAPRKVAARRCELAVPSPHEDGADLERTAGHHLAAGSAADTTARRAVLAMLRTASPISARVKQSA